MARRNRQTFKKRSREMAKKQKRQEKADRLAARKTGDPNDPAASNSDTPERSNPPADEERCETVGGMKVIVRRGK